MVRLELRHYRAVLALRHHRTVTAAAAALGLPLSWHAVYHRAHLDRYIRAELCHSLRDWCQSSALVGKSL